MILLNTLISPTFAQESEDYRVAINHFGENRIDVDFVDIEVTAENAVELAVAGAMEANDSAEIQAMNNQLQTELKASFEGQSRPEVVNHIEGLEAEIGQRISDINGIDDDSDDWDEIHGRQVSALNGFRAKLRSEFDLNIYSQPDDDNTNDDTNDVDYETYVPISIYNTDASRLIYLEWGSIQDELPACVAEAQTNSDNDIFDDNGDVRGCEALNVTYEGVVQVSEGELTVVGDTFGENDTVTVNDDNHIEFSSNVGAFRDSIWLKFEPENDNQNVTITVVMNDISVNGRIGDVSDKTYNLEGDHQLRIESSNEPYFVDEDNVDLFIEGRSQISDRIGSLEMLELRLRANSDDTNSAILRGMINDLKAYNFYGNDTSKISGEIDATLSAVAGIENRDTLQSRINELRLDMEDIKDESRMAKYQMNIIPFKDTDDHMWYTPYVSKIESQGVVSGYETKSGSNLGEFRPENYVTVAESLKIALEIAGRSEAGIPNMEAAKGHWAARYVDEAESTNMSIVSTAVDLDRRATRAEVTRMMLEALGISIPSPNEIEFDDVSANHESAAYIDYAHDISIVSGDDNTDNFRPDNPINRAEVAKIAYLTENILLGEE